IFKKDGNISPQAYFNLFLLNFFPILLARRFCFQWNSWASAGMIMVRINTPGLHPGLINYAPLELRLGGYFAEGAFLFISTIFL
ncbi:MAG TPA: hypothetical protein DEQ87_21040, partial [Algoriphagus sp.]|uniref:hypothetical protein n=1 Tax=Algoriphagus sp. TaxID=1872435 RepID=UPI000EE0F806